MVRDISGLGGPPTNTDASSAGRSSKTTERAQPATASADRPVAQDDVELSAEAKSLNTLADKVSALPDVDEQRVADVKAALERGEFSINNQKVADKILAADSFF